MSPPSAIGRLAARARRPAVAVPGASPGIEVVQAPQPVAAPRPSVSLPAPGLAPVPASAVAPAPSVAAATLAAPGSAAGRAAGPSARRADPAAGSGADAGDGTGAPQAVAEALLDRAGATQPAAAHVPAGAPALADAAPLAAASPAPTMPASRAARGAHAMPANREANPAHPGHVSPPGDRAAGPAGAPGWQILAEPSADPPDSEGLAERSSGQPPAPGMPAAATPVTGAQPRAVADHTRPTEPVRAAATVAVLAPQPPGTPPAVGAGSVAAAGATPTPTPSGPPNVVIDRIEIVTPPAQPRSPDPFASLADRRGGRSRHGRGRR